MGKYQSIIDLAIKEALKSNYKIKLGCVIFKGKKIFSIGRNELRNHNKLHPKFQKWKGSIHAEVNCIINAKKDLRSTTLLVIRINNDNELRLAKPCKDCMKYIKYVGIKKIIYSTSSYPYIQEESV